MVPTNGVSGRKSRNSTPPPSSAKSRAAAASGNKVSPQSTPLIKVPEVKAAANTRPALTARLATLKESLLPTIKVVFEWALVILVLVGLYQVCYLKVDVGAAALFSRAKEALSQALTQVVDAIYKVVPVEQILEKSSQALRLPLLGCFHATQVIAQIAAKVPSIPWEKIPMVR